MPIAFIISREYSIRDNREILNTLVPEIVENIEVSV